MFIQLTDKYAITGDEHAWIIQKKHVAKSGKNKGQVKWESIKWLTSAQSAVNTAAQMELRTCDAQSAADLEAFAKTLSERLTQALTPHYKVKLDPTISVEEEK